MLPGQDSESMVLGKVKGRKRDHNGVLIGSSNPNPILNTAVYNIDTPHGNIHDYNAKAVAKTLWNDTDDHRWDYGLLYNIIGHCKNEDVIPKLQGFTEIPTGAQR